MILCERVLLVNFVSLALALLLAGCPRNDPTETERNAAAPAEGRPVPPAVEATRAAVAAADARIAVERQVGGYRIGLFVGAARPLYRRQADGSLREEAPTGDRFVAIVLREGRTKRFLPAAHVSLRPGDGEPVELAHFWGEFPLYGTNLSLPDGPVEAVVDVSPPAYCRHGDMLAVFVKPAQASFALRSEDGQIVVEGDPPAPEAEDYSIGDDVLQAIDEARWTGEAGPYFVGFITEAPEPFWLWKDGRPELQPVSANDTHHLEIALMEKDTLRMVPEAGVTLRLRPKHEEGDALEIEMYPLLSSFYHYGNTVAVAPGRYEVTARIDPPAFGSLAPGVFDAPVEVTFPWNNERETAATAP